MTVAQARAGASDARAAEAARSPAATAVLITAASSAGVHAKTQLLCGRVGATTQAPRGRLCWVEPGQIVVLASDGAQRRTFVFRTLGDAGAALSTRIPAVHRPVMLLVQTATLRRRAVLGRWLRRLKAAGRDPSLLPDILYRKLDALLARRAPSDALLQSLLEHHDATVTV